jgi:hypothetical protein
MALLFIFHCRSKTFGIYYRLAIADFRFVGKNQLTQSTVGHLKQVSIPHLLIKTAIRRQICNINNYYVCRYGNWEEVKTCNP